MSRKYYEHSTEHIKEDANGNITSHKTSETKSFITNDEPDYIKIYTKMWCEFNNVPEKWRTLFLSLVCRMNYANLNSPTGGQTVYTIGSNAEAIKQECGWKTNDPLYRGLKVLCDCGAIRKIGRGEYQINPQYAGRGTWRYNAKDNQGGIKDIIAKFSFKNKNVETKITWAETNENIIGKNTDQVIATETTIK